MLLLVCSLRSQRSDTMRKMMFLRRTWWFLFEASLSKTNRFKPDGKTALLLLRWNAFGWASTWIWNVLAVRLDCERKQTWRGQLSNLVTERKRNLWKLFQRQATVLVTVWDSVACLVWRVCRAKATWLNCVCFFCVSVIQCLRLCNRLRGFSQNYCPTPIDAGSRFLSRI